MKTDFLDRFRAERNRSFAEHTGRTTREENAVHEAGHVLVLNERGIEWRKVFLTDTHSERGIGGRVVARSHRTPPPEAWLAGTVAEQVVGGNPDRDDAEVEWLTDVAHMSEEDWELYEVGSDEQEVARFLWKLPEDEREARLTDCFRWLRAFFTERQDDLLLIAEALDREGYLTPRHIDDLLHGELLG